MTASTLRRGERQGPVDLPSWRDARLHTAAVILSVHAIGIGALGFRVSTPRYSGPSSPPPSSTLS